jgi:hypothetical protein
MISESLWQWGLSFPFMISESLGGCVGCRIHATPMTAVRWSFMSPKGLFGLSNPGVAGDNSLVMISESLKVLWAVKSTRHS